jgi:hypothetical protein
VVERINLTIAEELGDRASISRSYHQLGMIAQDGRWPRTNTLDL